MAGAVAALAVRERTGRRHGCRGRPAGAGPRRRPGAGAGRRRRHRRHRLRLPVRHVRAQRRRALRLLRQRGLHEHRRAALRRDPAGRAHRHHRGGRRRTRATRSGRARTSPASRWRTTSPTSPRPPSPTCTTSRPRCARAMSLRGCALSARARAVPARLGLRRRRTPSGSPGWPQRSGPVPGVRGRARRGHRRLADPTARCRSRSTCGRRAATRTCSATTHDRRRRRGSRPIADRNIALRPTGASTSATHRRRTTDMNKPFAITLDVRSSRANHTGSWRTERPVYVKGSRRAATRARPARTCRRWLYDAEDGRRLRAAWRKTHGRQPVPGRHGPRLLPPVRDRLQPRRARRRPSASTRSSGSSGDEAIKQGWHAAEADVPRPGARCSSSAPGPAGLVGRLPAAPGSATRSRSATPVDRPAA